MTGNLGRQKASRLALLVVAMVAQLIVDVHLVHGQRILVKF